MADIAEVTFDTWNEYKRDLIPELFGRKPFRPGQYLFRGCGNAEWALVSAFDRRFSHLPTSERVKLWNSLVSSFRSACLNYGVARTVVEDEYALLAFGQHYGLPTRMLDWSLSPYVATFFAVRNAISCTDSTQSVAVWALDAGSDAWSKETGVEIVAPPTLDNIRLRNQLGRFTLSRTPFSSLEEHVRHSDVQGQKPLIKLTFPASEAPHALPDLEAMGVSAEYLFPDFSGLTESVILREELATYPHGRSFREQVDALR